MKDDEQGYPWLFFHTGKSIIYSSLVGGGIIAASVIVYIWYSSVSKDNSPDSFLGYTLAFLGTGLMLMAGIRFSMQRRAKKRQVGQLNATLNWHIIFGVSALVVLFLHAFGNYNPRSGTYALFGMIALAVSGSIGKLLDHATPRILAEQVRKALTAQGEDKIETISRQLRTIVAHNTMEQIASFPATYTSELSMAGISSEAPEAVNPKRARPAPKQEGNTRQVLQASWDLAYISLEETPQEVKRDTVQYRFVPDRKSSLAQPGALIPGAQERIMALEDVQQALKKEAFLRYTIRYWRIFHISLAVLTVGLTLWHLEYASTLLLPLILPH